MNRENTREYGTREDAKDGLVSSEPPSKSLVSVLEDPRRKQ